MNISIFFNYLKNIPLLIIIFTISTISCDSNKKSKIGVESIKTIERTEIPTFLLYGELTSDGYAEDQDSTTTKNFGFLIKRVAGCEITTSLVDSVHTINKRNDELMQSKYGKDWKENFEKKSNLKLAIPEI